eukprot:12411759-Karenia_brevis.AAC.1
MMIIIISNLILMYVHCTSKTPQSAPRIGLLGQRRPTAAAAWIRPGRHLGPFQATTTQMCKHDICI